MYVRKAAGSLCSLPPGQWGIRSTVLDRSLGAGSDRVVELSHSARNLFH